MKDIKAIRGRNYILSLIEEGEHVHQDFKFAISDARKIARSISAFANHEGGHLLVGVKDNGVPVGIRNEEDIYVIETAAEIFCSPRVDVDIKAYNVAPGVVVLKADIPRALRPPVYVNEAGGEVKAYYRVKDENICAPELLIMAWEKYASGESATVCLDSTHHLLFSLLSDHGCITAEQFIREAHISRARAYNLLSSLLASSSLALSHNGHEFIITLPSPAK